MKNPFVKQDNSVMVVSIALGSVAAGAAAYLFLTEKGAGIRNQMTDKLGWLGKLFAKNEQANEHDTSYLEKPRKAPKTNKNELLHHEVINEQPDITN